MPRGRPKKQPDTQSQGNGAGTTRGGRINKMQCVRDALDELGNDAQPKDIQGFLKRKFDLDMDTKFISTYKGTILRGTAKKSGGVRRPAAVAASNAPKAARANGGISFEDIRAVKALVDRLGADSVRQLAEVLA